jgi:hypothetical protein
MPAALRNCGLSALRRNRHMRICCECREYLAASQKAPALGRTVLPWPDPDDVPAEPVKAVSGRETNGLTPGEPLE